jgi:hypothetical protein
VLDESYGINVRSREQRTNMTARKNIIQEGSDIIEHFLRQVKRVFSLPSTHTYKYILTPYHLQQNDPDDLKIYEVVTDTSL